VFAPLSAAACMASTAASRGSSTWQISSAPRCRNSSQSPLTTGKRPSGWSSGPATQGQVPCRRWNRRAHHVPCGPHGGARGGLVPLVDSGSKGGGFIGTASSSRSSSSCAEWGGKGQVQVCVTCPSWMCFFLSECVAVDLYTLFALAHANSPENVLRTDSSYVWSFQPKQILRRRLHLGQKIERNTPTTSSF